MLLADIRWRIVNNPSILCSTFKSGNRFSVIYRQAAGKPWILMLQLKAVNLTSYPTVCYRHHYSCQHPHPPNILTRKHACSWGSCYWSFGVIVGTLKWNYNAYCKLDIVRHTYISHISWMCGKRIYLKSKQGLKWSILGTTDLKSLRMWTQVSFFLLIIPDDQKSNVVN